MAATLTIRRSGRQDHCARAPQDQRLSRYARRPVSADEETPELDDEVVPCTVCRGTGTLISNLGGTPSNVDCAWCEGTGTFLPDHDAQAAKKAEREAAGAADEGEQPAAAPEAEAEPGS